MEICHCAMYNYNNYKAPELMNFVGNNFGHPTHIGKLSSLVTAHDQRRMFPYE